MHRISDAISQLADNAREYPNGPLERYILENLQEGECRAYSLSKFVPLIIKHNGRAEVEVLSQEGEPSPF